MLIMTTVKIQIQIDFYFKIFCYIFFFFYVIYLKSGENFNFSQFALIISNKILKMNEFSNFIYKII